MLCLSSKTTRSHMLVNVVVSSFVCWLVFFAAFSFSALQQTHISRWEWVCVCTTIGAKPHANCVALNHCKMHFVHYAFIIECIALKSIITRRLMPLIWMMCWVIYLRCIYWLALPIWHVIDSLRVSLFYFFFNHFISLTIRFRMIDLFLNKFGNSIEEVKQCQNSKIFAHFLFISVQSSVIFFFKKKLNMYLILRFFRLFFQVSSGNGKQKQSPIIYVVAFCVANWNKRLERWDHGRICT